MYHNKAMDIKNGTKSSSYKSKSAGELKKIRDNILSGVEEAEKERQAQEMRRKYGDV